MAVTTFAKLIQELDAYMRRIFVKHLSGIPPEYPVFSKEQPWPKNGDLFVPFIREGQAPTIGPAPELGENMPIVAQALTDGRSRDKYSVRFGTAVAFTYKKLRMGMANLSSAKRPAEYLADSVRMTYETFFGALLSEAFSSTENELLGFDGQPLCSTAHVLLDGVTTVSNRYATAAEPSYTVLQDIMTAMARTVTDDNFPDPSYRVNALWVPPEAETPALEAIASMGRPDTAERADNVLGARMASSLAKSGVKVLTWMPDAAWFAVDTARHELTRYTLEAPRVEGPIVDTHTKEHEWQVSFWVARALWGWRGIYGVLRP